MDMFDLLAKGWPMLLALITLIIVLSKLDLRVAEPRPPWSKKGYSC